MIRTVPKSRECMHFFVCLFVVLGWVLFLLLLLFVFFVVLFCWFFVYLFVLDFFLFCSSFVVVLFILFVCFALFWFQSGTLYMCLQPKLECPCFFVGSSLESSTCIISVSVPPPCYRGSTYRFRFHVVPVM